ncbi:MAG: exodeoxyribonuclease VII large subunit [Syntrophomonadaceae bacterium]|jgi:exodeoxyribonuclease VII large subunit|nr:exodeoxyribonuclease VII large subunit [Syntrophomonadaceae bacterium]
MKEYLTVSQLNNHINRLLIGDAILQDFWLKGEISGFRLYQQSGHAYFTLKDEESAVSCVMFKSRVRNLKFKPEDGMEVLIRGSIAVYARQGKYQIYAEEMQPYGIGGLFLYLEELKNRLKAQGYFDQEKKKPIPALANRVGVVTSQDGAAFQDILRVLKLRHPGVEIILVHSSVQGVDAPLELAAGIKLLNEHAIADVIIVGRGGGSFEDLMAFNSEEVVEAIYESKLPVISAVGHEVDYCLADLAADLRAATPTQAAQLAVPDMLHLQAGIDDYQQRLLRATSNRINQYSETLDRVMMRRVWREPEILLGKSGETLVALQNEMLDAVLENWKVKEREFSVIVTALDKLSPLKVLSRGYAMVRQGEKIVRQVEEVTLGASLQIDLYDGIVDVSVDNRERVERWKR